MQRARRLATAVVVASLAVAGLSACRTEPSVAAYVGPDGRITESQVQKIWDEAHAAVVAAAKKPRQSADGAADPSAAPGQVTMPITRSDIVRVLISKDVLTEVAKRHNVTAPADLGLDNYAAELRLPQTVEFVRLYAQADTLVKMLREGAQNAPAPTDADLREVFDILIKNGVIEPKSTFEDFKANLPEQNKQLVQTSAAVRTQITEVAAPLHIRVNPRYQPLGIPVLEFQTQSGDLRPLLVAPLGANDDAPPVLSAR